MICIRHQKFLVDIRKNIMVLVDKLKIDVDMVASV